jgi:hypothetical protein
LLKCTKKCKIVIAGSEFSIWFFGSIGNILKYPEMFHGG